MSAAGSASATVEQIFDTQQGEEEMDNGEKESHEETSLEVGVLFHESHLLSVGSSDATVTRQRRRQGTCLLVAFDRDKTLKCRITHIKDIKEKRRKRSRRLITSIVFVSYFQI